MYSRLNTLVNEINSLGVKQIEDLELIRKILHSLRRPEYDLVTTILYEKELSTMTPNEVLNKVIAHEIRNDIKPRAPPSSPTHSALTSNQEKLLRRWQSREVQVKRKGANAPQVMKMESLPPSFYKQVKIINKSLKKINLMGYMVSLKDGPHHQLMKVERRFKKKKKEKKPKEEAFVVLDEGTSGGDESNTNSSDESNKTFTTRFNTGMASSSNI